MGSASEGADALGSFVLRHGLLLALENARHANEELNFFRACLGGPNDLCDVTHPSCSDVFVLFERFLKKVARLICQNKCDHIGLFRIKL